VHCLCTGIPLLGDTLYNAPVTYLIARPACMPKRWNSPSKKKPFQFTYPTPKISLSALNNSETAIKSGLLLFVFYLFNLLSIRPESFLPMNDPQSFPRHAGCLSNLEKPIHPAVVVISTFFLNSIQQQQLELSSIAIITRLIKIIDKSEASAWFSAAANASRITSLLRFTRLPS